MQPCRKTNGLRSQAASIGWQTAATAASSRGSGVSTCTRSIDSRYAAAVAGRPWPARRFAGSRRRPWRAPLRPPRRPRPARPSDRSRRRPSAACPRPTAGQCGGAGRGRRVGRVQLARAIRSADGCVCRAVGRQQPEHLAFDQHTVAAGTTRGTMPRLQFRFAGVAGLAHVGVPPHDRVPTPPRRSARSWRRRRPRPACRPPAIRGPSAARRIRPRPSRHGLEGHGRRPASWDR